MFSDTWTSLLQLKLRRKGSDLPLESYPGPSWTGESIALLGLFWKLTVSLCEQQCHADGLVNTRRFNVASTGKVGRTSIDGFRGYPIQRLWACKIP